MNLLVHAEQSLADAPEKTISIRTSVLGKRLLVEIGFTAPPDPRTPNEAAGVLELTRGVIAGHGGEVRLIQKPASEPRFELELPLRARERTLSSAALIPPVRENGRTLTVMVIEPDDTSQHQLMALFGWTNPQQAAVYTRKANRARLEATAARLLQGQNSNKSVPLFPAVILVDPEARHRLEVVRA